MPNLLSNRRWKLPVLVLSLLLFSSACATSTGSPTASAPTPASLPIPGSPAASAPTPVSLTPQVLTVQSDIAFGPGTFDFPDTKTGLAELSSYKATLALSFDGTQDGKAQKWAKTYVMLAAKEPARRQLTLVKTGDLPDVDALFVAEMDGAAYEARCKSACRAAVIDPENSQVTELEPTGFLSGVIGADAAGSEKVNGAAATHYKFDERALGLSGVAKSSGEMWVASDGGYIVKYLATTKGNADYFGDGIEGAITWDYELTDVNKPVTLTLPADCPAGMVDAPQLPDASNVIKMPSVLTYDTSSSMADAAAFYQKQIPTLGWKLVGNPTASDTSTLLSFTQGDQEMTVVISAGQGGTKVSIVLSRAQK